jgi:hypothetical protein
MRTTVNWRMALVFGAIAVMVATATAVATHPRPKGATPIRVSLVPAYDACTAPNHTHGPPLAFPSCNPPVQSSNFLTVGTPDSNGAGANSTGFVRIAVSSASPGEAAVSAVVTDVRCKAGTSTCGNANTTSGPDYTGELRSNATIRITDHNNSASPGGGTDAATVVDLPFPINLTCSNTADTAIGGSCTIAGGQPLSMVPVPNPTEPTRSVVEVTQVEVFDGGADGLASTTPNTVFMREGIFIP